MEQWFFFTLVEALAKTGSKLLQKVVGNESVSLAAVCYATLIIGLIQVAVSYGALRSHKHPVKTEPKLFHGSVLFGTGAFLSSVFAFAAFFYGAHVGINTFIITLGIIPGAMIDRIFFGHRFSFRQIMGILIAVGSGYLVLNRPSLADLASLPLWIWLSFATMMTVSINQGITQWVKDVHPMVKNFWGGMATAILSFWGMVLFSEKPDFSFITWKLTWVSAMIGLIVVVMWSMNVMAYKKGAFIAIKKLVLNGTYLITAAILGAWFFHEPLYAGQLLGFFLIIGAFSLMDKTTWEFIWKGGFLLKKRKAALAAAYADVT